jgi:serine/threonine protein kinase
MHANDIAHGDIKPHNFVVDQKNSRFAIKAIDFGTVQWRHADRGYARAMTTYWFVAPEDAVSNRWGPAADIWALGLTMFYYWTRTYPLQFTSHADAAQWFNRNKSISLWRTRIPPRMFRLIERMLVFDPDRRITAAEILAELGETPVAGTVRPVPRRDDDFAARIKRDRACAPFIIEMLFRPWSHLEIATISRQLGWGRRRTYRAMRRIIRNLF